MGYIYKITNQINGKMYIGKTEHINPYDRWKEHKSDYKRRKNENRRLYNSMNYHGIDNFSFEVIDCVEDGQPLCEAEKYYINKYRTYIGFFDCNGYNCSLGGDGRSYLNLDEQEVIRIHKENEYIVGRTANYFGVDPKSIEKILIKNNIGWLNRFEITEKNFIKQYGGLLQIDIDNGYIVDIYKTPYDALQKNPKYKAGTLSMAYGSGSKTHKAYGYVWYRLYELPKEYKPLLEEYCINSDNLEIDDTMLNY